MASKDYLVRLQGYLGYWFHNVSLLEKALTAPGAEGNKKGSREEKDKYEGNRSLAQIGDSLISLVVRQTALYEENASRSSANNALKAAASKTNHAERAKLLGIQSNMRLNVRSRGIAEPNTLNLAMCAILGAVWLDCGRDSLVIGPVVKRLFLGVESQPSVDPKLIYFKDLASINEFVVDEVLDNPTDVTSSDTNLSSSQGPISCPEIDVDTFSPETQPEGSNVPQRISIPHSTSKGIHCQEISENEISGIFLPQRNASTPNDGDSFSQVLNHTMEEIRWSTPSASYVSATMSPINGFSRSSSSFPEFHSPGEASIQSHSSTVLRSGPKTPNSDDGDLSQEIVGRIELPCQSYTDSIDHLSIKRASASNLDEQTRKRKSGPSRSITRLSKSTVLEEYILLEKTRCQSLGLPSFENGLDEFITQASSIQGDTITNLKTLYFGIASPESLAGLGELLRVHRHLFSGKEVTQPYSLSQIERVKVIDGLNDKIGYYNLLKRCHIHQLYVDSSAGSQKTSEGFFNSTTYRIKSRASPQMGNPIHLEDSRITKLILRELYPKLAPDSNEYKKKLRFVGDLRKLGERLHLLVEKFGYGILGLLLVPVDEPNSQPGLSITNTLILSIPNNTFRELVCHLDRLQGNILRAITNTVSKAVEAIFRGEMDQSIKFRIESLDQAQIVQYPRGSKELLRLISSTEL